MHRDGTVEIVRHASVLLKDNPLGDSAERDLAIYLPPSYESSSDRRRFPVIYLLAGFTGSGLQLINRGAWTLPLHQRMNQLIADGRAAEAILVLPDCFTRYGGSQYVDSPAIGRYQSYLTEELVPFVDERYRTLADREHRAVAGKSSGGYGALNLAFTRPDLFSRVASHAGDSAFDLSYLKEFGRTLLTLEKRGGVKGFLSWFDALPGKSGSGIEVMSNLCCAAAWSPSASGPYGYGEGFELPFDLYHGALKLDVWARWLERDPVRMLDNPKFLEAARSLQTIYLDAGVADEYNLQLGTRQVAHKLKQANIAVTHEEFDGGHMNTPYRYDRSIAVLTESWK